MSAHLAGHGLVAEGRVWTPGELPRNGEGKAVCGCGLESPVLPSAQERKQWHRDHKADIRSARGLDSTVTAPYSSGGAP